MAILSSSQHLSLWANYLVLFAGKKFHHWKFLFFGIAEENRNLEKSDVGITQILSVHSSKLKDSDHNTSGLNF